MNKILDYMQRGLSPVAIAMSNNKYFIALRDGMAPALPIIVFGSFLMLIPNLPITESIIGADAVAGFKNFAGQSSDIAMNITAMICAFSVAYYFAKREKVDPLMAGWASLASFLMINFEYPGGRIQSNCVIQRRYDRTVSGDDDRSAGWKKL